MRKATAAMPDMPDSNGVTACDAPLIVGVNSLSAGNSWSPIARAEKMSSFMAMFNCPIAVFFISSPSLPYSFSRALMRAGTASSEESLPASMSLIISGTVLPISFANSSNGFLMYCDNCRVISSPWTRPLEIICPIAIEIPVMAAAESCPGEAIEESEMAFMYRWSFSSPMPRFAR